MHRQEQPSFGCLPVSVQVPRGWEMKKQFEIVFFPPARQVLVVGSVRSEACKGKDELSTHGVATSAGQNPEICLGNSVTLSIIKNDQS